MAQLSHLVESEGFFQLSDTYGQRVPGGSTKAITIRQNGVSKTVATHFLMNWVHSEDPVNQKKLQEAARPVRILQCVREWFAHPKAVDLSRYRKMVLNRVEELKTGHNNFLDPIAEPAHDARGSSEGSE
jgi:hypothetical protein